jgi:hypothetical protein
VETGGQKLKVDVCVLSQNSRYGGDLSPDRSRKALVQWVKIGIDTEIHITESAGLYSSP